MEFYNVDSYDHFQDMTIFWVTLLDIPIELKNRAALIDGDNYDEKGFGVCVAFDTETQKYELVVDMDKDEARTVYYIDNDGDKRWFACEVPEELAEHIFSECQQILNFQKIEDGYEIKESVQFVDNSGFVLAEKPNSDRPYITAYFFTTDLGQRYSGPYCLDKWRLHSGGQPDQGIPHYCGPRLSRCVCAGQNPAAHLWGAGTARQKERYPHSYSRSGF